MARGWESKSIDSQVDSAQSEKHPADQAGGPDPAYLELVRKKETLILSRTRVLHELEVSQNERYRLILNRALADLNEKLSEMTKACAARAATAS